MPRGFSNVSCASVCRHVPLFQEIAEVETLIVIASRCVMHRYEEGEHIVVEGCEGESM